MTQEIKSAAVHFDTEFEIARMETDGPAGGIPTSVSKLELPSNGPDIFAKFSTNGSAHPLRDSVEGEFSVRGVIVQSSWEGLDKTSAAKRVAQAEAYYIGREHSMPD